MLIEARPHPEYRGLYVTKDGRVFQELSANQSANGYHTIKVRHSGRNGKPVTVRRHRLVLEAFHGPANGRVARHLDGDPGHDHADNLAWGTQRENCGDTIRHGRTTCGTKNAQSKLTEAQVLEIRDRYAAGESGKALAAEFGIAQPTVVEICKRRTWRHI